MSRAVTGTPQEPDRSRLLVAIAINQLATPGLGSLMVGRRLAGACQLLIASAGFALVVTWFGRLYAALFQHWRTGQDVTVGQHRLWALGVTLFAGAWLWAGFTSLSIWRAARRSAPTLASPPRLRP